MDKDLFDYFDDLDDHDGLPAALRFDSQRPRNPAGRISKVLEERERAFVKVQDHSRETIRFSYQAARFEEWWLLESLYEFYEYEWIADVLQRVRGGKEASVYLCRGGTAIHSDLAAVKVYRPRSLRNLRNDGLYREGRANLDGEGRQVIDDGMLHAMEKKSVYGQELLHQSWIAYEFVALKDLHAAGADVPEPYVMAKNAILMEFIGEDGFAAPSLNEISLDRSESGLLFDRILANLDILLSQRRIHGDLSAYNILYWEGKITIIDFPQVISPTVNRQAYSIFSRDVKRVCEYFARQGIESNAKALAESLWISHGYALPRNGDDADA